MRTLPFARPILGSEEQKAVAAVLAGPILTHGQRVREFEHAFATFVGAEHAVATASCTAAMHTAYLYLGIGPGDEVIVPAQTHVATAHAVEYCGAKPVFIDSERQTGNLDLDQIEACLSERTKAIAVVHYLGMPVDTDRVAAIAQKHNLFVVEDCALALGTKFQDQHVGLVGDVGCFSFYPAKHITTAEGGMLITRRAEVAEKIAVLRAFGIDRNVVSEREVPGVYDVPMLGFNYRLNEIGAAMGIEQLKRLPGFLETRRENYECMSAGLQEIDELELLQSSHGEFSSSHYCQVMILKDELRAKRPEIIQLLGNQGIGTSIYYPRPVPEMAYYQREYGPALEPYPIASRLSEASIALPVGPHLDLDDVRYIVDGIKTALAKVK